MIDENITLAELRKLPLEAQVEALGLLERPISEVVTALQPNYEVVPPRRHGPFGNIFLRPMVFYKVGDKVGGHCHNYDHITWLSQGALAVKYFEVDPRTKKRVGLIQERLFQAPAPIKIEKHISHEFTAIEARPVEPGIRADCIFALRNYKGEVVEHCDTTDLTAYT